MDNLYCDSLLLQPPRILGVQLRPFSSYHALVLLRFDNPLVCGGDVSESDLIQAVVICSQGFSDKLFGYLSLLNDHLPKIQYGARLLIHDIGRETEAIEDYIQQYSAGPDYWADGDAKLSGIEPPFQVAGALLQNMPGFSEEQVWDMPFTRALAYKACIAEQHGADVVNQSDIQKASEAEELFANMEAARN